MAARESYFWHKLHSLTGIVPVGFYLVQHLTLNSFALAGPDAYNSVIHFFEGMPKHVLLVLKYGLVWIPLIFHAVYGLFIVNRMSPYTAPKAKGFRENRYYNLQRWSGIFAFIFLCYHMATTSVAGSLYGVEKTILYDNWAAHLSAGFYSVLAFYVLGITASAYHFSYGIWNFCIRWGITISEAAQQRMARFAQGAFLALTVLGVLALVGFFYAPLAPKGDTMQADSAPAQSNFQTT
ncbi:MAG: hypothetical protein JNM85_02995 [Chthonomonas sp.]|nr:hypothetical protein [Chthonomonas sp.]